MRLGPGSVFDFGSSLFSAIFHIDSSVLLRPNALFGLQLLPGGGAVFFADDRTHFNFALPARPVLAMHFEKFGAALECGFFIGIFENRVAANHFLGFGEPTIADLDLAISEAHAGARVRSTQLAASEQL